jgi:hypothetical protein
MANDGKLHPVSIKATYFLLDATTTKVDDGNPSTTAISTITQTFDAGNATEACIGLPENFKPIKPQPGDDSYSGMHDQGALLPVPKEGGPMALLLGCSLKAKEFNNTLLTEKIQQEKKHHADEQQQSPALQLSPDAPSQKKNKVEEPATGD